jgi:hypothetical protein
MTRDRVRLGMLAVVLATALTGLSSPPAQADNNHSHSWRIVGQTTMSSSTAGEGVATVRTPDGPLRVYYTGGGTIPAAQKAEGWGHIGDPDSLRGYIFDPYQQTVGVVTKKMMLVTTPTGQQYEYVHELTGDETTVNANAYTTASPDGQWLVAGELAPVTRLLVFPTPLLNPATPRLGGDLPLAARVLLDRPVRNLQGCDFASTTRLICASDDSNNDLFPTSKPLLQIDLAHPLRGKDVTAHVTALGQIPLRSTCVGAYTVEGVDYASGTGDLRVEVIPPSPCNTDTTIYTLR